jgi:hypothetical protein
MPCHDWLDYAGFGVQCLLLGGLVWYTLETRRIRHATQEQIETLQKPCVSFSTTTREANDAILDMDGAVGGMIAVCPNGLLQLENSGYGQAVNIRYAFTRVDLASTIVRPKGYLTALRQGEKFQPPIPRETLRGNEWSCVITYESLSGQHYRTEMTVNHLVLTSFTFGPY